MVGMLARIQLISPGGWSTSPRKGLFWCRPLPKRGQICDIPASPQSLNYSGKPHLYDFFVVTAHQMGIKAVVNTERGLLASRRVFCWLPLGFCCSYSTNSDESISLNTRIKKTREDCCIVPVNCKTVEFRFFRIHYEVRVPWFSLRSRVSCTPTEP